MDHSPSTRGTDQVAAQWLLHAVREGERGPEVDPNPRVGAVILDAGGQLAGVGHHAGAGSAHAEVMALAAAGDRARGGIAYITLEPCAHHGRTPPCAQALLAAGVASVIFAVADPGRSSGGGAERLRQAGVQVQGPPEVPAEVISAAEALAQPWLDAVRAGRPQVVWKFAATLDGRSAAADGSSRWITSPAARADVHDLRARCGAVVAGTGTILADDPALTARHPDGSLRDRQPLRVVVGRRDLPPTARVLDASATTLQLRTTDPADVLAELGDRQVHRVLLEGGPRLAGAFLRAGLVDEVVAYLAPALLGSGPPALGDAGVGTIADILRLHTLNVTPIGPDLRITARPARHPALAQKE